MCLVRHAPVLFYLFRIIAIFRHRLYVIWDLPAGKLITEFRFYESLEVNHVIAGDLYETRKER